MSEYPVGSAMWAEAERDRLDAVLGEEGLEGRWKLMQIVSDHGDVDEAIDILRDLMGLARDEARLDWQTRGYAEIKRIYASDPRYADLRQDLLWFSKWIAGGLADYAELSESTIESLLGEMQTLYEREGESLRPVYGERLDTALTMGRLDQADKWFALWDATPPGPSDDCSACEIDRRLDYLTQKKDYAKALEVGLPLLTDRSGCSNWPASLSRLMNVAMHQKDAEMAMGLHHMSSRFIRRSPAMLWANSTHIHVLTYLGQMQRARRLATSTLYRSKALRNEVQQFRLFRACATWAGFSVLRGFAIDAKSGRPVCIPKRCLPSTPDDATGVATLPEVAVACLQAARDIAAKLDARNGNNTYNDRLDEIEAGFRAMAERAQSNDTPPPTPSENPTK